MYITSSDYRLSTPHEGVDEMRPEQGEGEYMYITTSKVSAATRMERVHR